MLKVRSACHTDIPDIVNIAVEAAAVAKHPITISRSQIREMATLAVTAPAHFCWVSERDGKIVSLLAAMTQTGMWFERLHCFVVAYYSREPGAMLPLIRQFAKWVKDRPAIKIASFEVETETDQRVMLLLSRLGFRRKTITLSYVRGKT